MLRAAIDRAWERVSRGALNTSPAARDLTSWWKAVLQSRPKPTTVREVVGGDGSVSPGSWPLAVRLVFRAFVFCSPGFQTSWQVGTGLAMRGGAWSSPASAIVAATES